MYGNHYLCGGRLLKRLASAAGATFTIQESEYAGGRSLVDGDDALEENVLGPIVALQVSRVWKSLFPDYRGVTAGTSFAVETNSLVGLSVRWPLLGRDILSIYRMLAISHAAETLLDWERRQVVEVEQMVAWYHDLGAELHDDFLFVPAGNGLAAVRVPLTFIEGQHQVPQEVAHA
jgi:hypothetical protein